MRVGSFIIARRYTYRGLRPDLGQIEIPVLEKRVRKAISSAVPAFWDMDAIWSGWPAAVARAFSHEPVPPPELL